MDVALMNFQQDVDELVKYTQMLDICVGEYERCCNIISNRIYTKLTNEELLDIIDPDHHLRNTNVITMEMVGSQEGILDALCTIIQSIFKVIVNIIMWIFSLIISIIKWIFRINDSNSSSYQKSSSNAKEIKKDIEDVKKEIKNTQIFNKYSDDKLKPAIQKAVENIIEKNKGYLEDRYNINQIKDMFISIIYKLIRNEEDFEQVIEDYIDRIVLTSRKPVHIQCNEYLLKELFYNRSLITIAKEITSQSSVVASSIIMYLSKYLSLIYEYLENPNKRFNQGVIESIQLFLTYVKQNKFHEIEPQLKKMLNDPNSNKEFIKQFNIISENVNLINSSNISQYTFLHLTSFLDVLKKIQCSYKHANDFNQMKIYFVQDKYLKDIQRIINVIRDNKSKEIKNIEIETIVDQIMNDEFNVDFRDLIVQVFKDPDQSLDNLSKKYVNDIERNIVEKQINKLNKLASDVKTSLSALKSLKDQVLKTNQRTLLQIFQSTLSFINDINNSLNKLNLFYINGIIRPIMIRSSYVTKVITSLYDLNSGYGSDIKLMCSLIKYVFYSIHQYLEKDSLNTSD